MFSKMFAGVLSLALLSLAGCTTNPVPDPTAQASGPPHAFKYTLGFSTGREASVYESSGDFVSKRFAATSDPSSDQGNALIRRKPSAVEWERFWQTLARLRTWEWQRTYDSVHANPPRIISDGICWEWYCAHGDQHVQASGCNAYPALGNPQNTTLDDATIVQLEHALDELVDPSGRKAR